MIFRKYLAYETTAHASVAAKIRALSRIRNGPDASYTAYAPQCVNIADNYSMTICFKQV